MNLTVSFIPQMLDVAIGPNPLSVIFANPVIRDYHEAEIYEGPYEFTPTQSSQTASVEGKACTQDITINPIPSYYGLITWDGSALTVS